MTHPMLEAAVRAARKQRTAYVGCEPPLIDYQIARAVLQPLMNPTEDMLRAGASYAYGSGLDQRMWDVGCTWQAMLTQALSENK